jgi:transducin (beta)-like 1
MEIDDIPNGNGHAYPSPKEVERPPTPIITDGPETGTQVDKVTELGSETTFLTLSDPENTDLKPYVLYTAWNPRDPTILVGAGTDKLARLWKISRGAAANDDSHVNYASTPYHDLVDRNFTARNPDCTSTTTAAAWTSDGAAIALASEWLDEFAVADRDSARVTLWGSDGSLIQEFGGFDPPIVCLQWNPSNTLLLALMLDGNTSLITIFQPTNQSTLQFPLPEHTMDMQPLEAVWTGEHEFVVCGGDLLCAFSCSDSAIVRTRKFETREDHRLIKATYDRHSRLLATASESGVIDVSYVSKRALQRC